MNKKEFPEFWYESNACWGWVRNIDDLRQMYLLQTDPFFGALKDDDEFLDKSKQEVDGSLDFGTRMEHKGKKTLRTFLIENEVDILKLKK